MRILNSSLLITSVVFLASCSGLVVENNSQKKIVFNPKSELGIAGDQLNEMVANAKKAGGKAPEFLATDLFIKGNDASMRGDFQTASQIFKYVAELVPEDIYVQKKLAIELIRVGELKEAEKILENVFKITKGSDESVGLILAGVYSAAEKMREAQGIYQRLLTFKPDSEEACLFLAKSYAGEKLFKEAHQLLANCEKKSDANPVFSFYRGKMDYDRGMKKEAKVHFDRSLKADPTYYQAALAVGALYEEQEKYNLALKVYKDFLNDEGNASSIPVLSRLVTVLFSLEKNEEVVPYAEALVALDDTDLNLKVRLGILYSEAERFLDATKIFKEVLAVVPESDKVLYYLGALHQQIGKPIEAMDYYHKITGASPLYGDAGLQIAQTLGNMAREEIVQGKLDFSKKFNSFIEQRAKDNPDKIMELKMLQASFFEDTFQYKEAIATMESLKTHKNFTESHNYYLASIFEKSGEYLEARKIVQALIDKDPNNAHALNFLGYSYLERNEKLDVAFEYISKAVTLRPDDGYIRDSLAWYYYQVGKFQEALGEAKKAFELVKDDSTITKHLGMIYRKLRHYDKAKTYLTEAAKLSRAKAEREDVLKILEEIENIRLPASNP